ncbi:iron-sulfur cluster assembly protein [Ferroglobus sp.]|uniref:iron-sulfur cluster assembly protein n=1 Tax=Ferroglobus sp. TaxID=2614230 RepID=UPI0025BCEF36|nr:iron-sulfur cluster assembly protein [Ferroglobus sp.]
MRAKDILNLLKDVKEPTTGESIIDLGLVEGVVVKDEIVVYVNFLKAMPGCKACVPLAYLIVGAIVREIERAFEKTGMKYRIVEVGTFRRK